MRGCGEVVWLKMETFWPLSNQWRAVAKCSSVLFVITKFNYISFFKVQRPLWSGAFSPASSVAEQQGVVRGKPEQVHRMMWRRLNILPNSPRVCFGTACLRRTTQKIYQCSLSLCRVSNGLSRVPISCHPHQKTNLCKEERCKSACGSNGAFSWQKDNRYPEECLSPVTMRTGRESDLRKKRERHFLHSLSLW